MRFELRDYQQAAVDSVFAYWERGGPGSPVVVVPTGGGKSPILGEVCRVLVEVHGARVMAATHRKELIEQDRDAVRAVWPLAPVGIYSASIGEKRVCDITVAQVQSAWRNAHVFGKVDVLLIDEAHLVSTEDGTMYHTLIRKLRESQPDMRLVGLTATPYRMGQGHITQGEGALFDTVCYRIKETDLVRDAYLAPLTAGSPSTKVDLANVATVAGEFVARDLELAADLDTVNVAVAQDVATALREGRRSAMVFAVSVTHAEHMRVALSMAGVRAEVVVGSTPGRERILQSFKRGELPCIISCDVLTTGFDAPCVDVLAVIRATQSPGLYVQIMGRGMRPVYAHGMPLGTVEERRAAMAAGPKPQGCMVLDYGGNIARHGPITAVREPPPKGSNKAGVAPHKVCPKCSAEVPASALACIHCDHEFPPPEKTANAKASDLDPLAPAAPPREHRIEEVFVDRHVGKNSATGVPTMKVSFMGYGDRYPCHTEYICMEHEGYARSKAEMMWRKLFVGPCPHTVADGMAAFDAGDMRVVKSITVTQDGKFTRLVSAEVEDRVPGMDDAPHASMVDTAPDEPWDDDIPF
jgi:DNA repair protein RadD